jgi:hypothetical protein|tara:strand:+ start:109 stop:528 length:420 start_codon:yes stop_codon:yes gene_type:complete
MKKYKDLTNEQKIRYEYDNLIKYAKNHIEEVEWELDRKEKTIEYLADMYIDYRGSMGEDIRTATREVYKQLTETEKEFLDKCPSEFLTRKEQEDWFDNYHDDLIYYGPDANTGYKNLMHWTSKTIKDLQLEGTQEGAAA